VQLFIDGALAGVVWPFPVIFTGGVVPGLWRPIVGIDAFELKEDEIDITPWLPLLCDGQSHNFSIRVSGLSDDGNGTASLSETTNSYWLITGKVRFRHCCTVVASSLHSLAGVRLVGRSGSHNDGHDGKRIITIS